MELNGGTLPSWLNDVGSKYFKRYGVIEEWLNKNVHKEVVAGAMLADGGYLTDHGPDHINKVIQRSSELVGFDGLELTEYEVFLLLVACHMHDVGNINGRVEHELYSGEFLTEIKPLIGEDDVVLSRIYRIAQAHGGTEKDKLRDLPREEHINNNLIKIRFLAAILKFADELSDDSTRASRYLLERGMIPAESEIYHKYAACLHSVVIDHGTQGVYLKFQVKRDDMNRKYGKLDKEVYLLDEIYERTLKTHYERVYCMRYFEKELILNFIDVVVDVYAENGFYRLETISYRIEDVGYPGEENKSIYDYCPDLDNWKDVGRLNGEVLAEKMSGD